MRLFSEHVRNAMQGVSDGRYATFEDAMEAISGTRPREIFEGDPDLTPEEEAALTTAGDVHEQATIGITRISKRPKSTS